MQIFLDATCASPSSDVNLFQLTGQHLMTSGLSLAAYFKKSEVGEDGGSTTNKAGEDGKGQTCLSCRAPGEDEASFLTSDFSAFKPPATDDDKVLPLCRALHAAGQSSVACTSSPSSASSRRDGSDVYRSGGSSSSSCSVQRQSVARSDSSRSQALSAARDRDKTMRGMTDGQLAALLGVAPWAAMAGTFAVIATQERKRRARVQGGLLGAENVEDAYA